MSSNSKCEPKPEGVEVKNDGTTLKTLELMQGWYRFSSTSTTVYLCPTYDNCRGGKIDENASVTNSLCRQGSGV